MITVRKGPLPAPCADCGVVIEWPSPFAFVAFGLAHLACVEAREAKLCDNCHMPSGAALLHQRDGGALGAVHLPRGGWSP